MMGFFYCKDSVSFGKIGARNFYYTCDKYLSMV